MGLFDKFKRIHGNNNQLTARALTDIVKKKSNTGLGAFIDLNNDLGLMIDEPSNQVYSVMMPYFYARRVANAGMYAQGIIDKATFDRVNGLFFGLMVEIGANLTKVEQIEFQEASFAKALELLSKYMFGITKASTALLVSAAGEGISLRDALFAKFDQVSDDVNDIVEPVMCYEGVLKHAYCLGYFASGWWEPGYDLEATSESLIKYFKSQGIDFDLLTDAADGHNYTVSGEGFSVEDTKTGHRLEVKFDGNMFHGVVLMPDQEMRLPLQPWMSRTNPFQDDFCFKGDGTRPLGLWWFSIEPTSPFSEILAEVEILHMLQK